MKNTLIELRDMLKENISNKDVIHEISSTLKKGKVRKLIDGLLTKDNLNNDEIFCASKIIEICQYIYNYTGMDTGITDGEYDVIREKLEDTGFVMGITVPIITSQKNDRVVYHKYRSLRGTLDKIYQLTDEDMLNNKSRKSIHDWVKTSENKIYEKTGERIDLWNEYVYCFPKWDGVSGIFEYDKNGNLLRVLTRGYTETNEAQDITHIFKGLKGPFENCEHEYGVKTEIMMSEQNHIDYNKNYSTNYKNSRSIVSSILNSDDLDDRAKYLQIMPLRTSYIDESGNETSQTLCPGVFDTPYIKCKLNELEKMREFAIAHGHTNGLRCDGMVIYLIDEKLQKILGRENDKQKFEVAYKFTEEVGYSVVKNINFTTGLFGRINPVLEIEPIKLKGNTITNISLGSIGRMMELRLAKNDKVKVLYDIIPYVILDEDDPKCMRSGNINYTPPKICPDCGEILEYNDSGILLYCKNKKCPCREKGKILNYLKKMKIENISFATVEILYGEGLLKNICDLYKLHEYKKKLREIPGFGEKSVDIILHEIDKKNTASYSQLLGSIGIEGVSSKMFQKVFSMITFDDLIELSLDDNKESALSVLTVIPGIKEKTAEKIINGIKENEKTILFLEEKLTLFSDIPTKSKFKVAFTKVRDENLEKFTLEHGGTVVDSLTKDTDVLVVPTIGVSSSKVDKAKKYNIDIVPIDSYQDYIINNFEIK